MKLISLNIWGGEILEPLLNFISSKESTVDIFCLQEVLNGKNEKPEHIVIKNAPNTVGNIYTKLKNILPNHVGFFAPSQNEAGLAIFVNKDIKVLKVGDFFVHRWKDSWENNVPETLGRNVQFIQFENNKDNFTISNFHGLWTGKGKGDTPQRLGQSRKVKDFLDKTNGANILCGDFNLLPNTKSLSLLATGMIDLVRDYKVNSTRSSLYNRVWDENDKFADYILVSKDVNVLDFKVLRDEVSDHLPLYLEFD